MYSDLPDQTVLLVASLLRTAGNLAKVQIITELAVRRLSFDMTMNKGELVAELQRAAGFQ